MKEFVLTCLSVVLTLEWVASAGAQSTAAALDIQPLLTALTKKGI